MPTEVTDPSANPLKVDEAHFAQLAEVVSNKRGVVKRLRALRLNGTDFYVTDRRENTLIHVAADADNINAARYLLKRGILKEHINHQNIEFYIDEQTKQTRQLKLDTPSHRLFPPANGGREPNYSFADLLLEEGANPVLINAKTGMQFYAGVPFLPRKTQRLKDKSISKVMAKMAELERLKEERELEMTQQRERERFKEVVNPDRTTMMGKLIDPVTTPNAQNVA